TPLARSFLAPPRSKGMVTLPPEPKVASGEPSGLSRTAAKSSLSDRLAKPATTILPLACRAMALARDWRTVPEASAKVMNVLPPVPKVRSKVLAFRRLRSSRDSSMGRVRRERGCLMTYPFRDEEGSVVERDPSPCCAPLCDTTGEDG